MKKLTKVLAITLLVIMALSTLSFAKIPEVKGQELSGDAARITDNVLGTLQTVGLVIAVGMGIFLGIKYVASSPEGKSQLKEQLGLYILGIVFILAATAIVTLIKSTIGA